MRTLCFAFAPAKMPSAPRGEDADAPGSLLPAADKSPQALAGSDAPDGPPGTLERAAGQLPSPPLLPTPLPKAVPKATKNVTGGSASVPRLPPPQSSGLTGLPLWPGPRPLLPRLWLWTGPGDQEVVGLFLARTSVIRSRPRRSLKHMGPSQPATLCVTVSPVPGGQRAWVTAIAGLRPLCTSGNESDSE